MRLVARQLGHLEINKPAAGACQAERAQHDQNGSATPAPDNPDSHELPFPVHGKDKPIVSPTKGLRGRWECYIICSGSRGAKTCMREFAVKRARSSVR